MPSLRAPLPKFVPITETEARTLSPPLAEPLAQTATAQPLHDVPGDRRAWHPLTALGTNPEKLPLPSLLFQFLLGLSDTVSPTE